ncbi:MAG TPA: hypothetical protein EYP10_09100, partial [Armatimonadetes bacterium]|nr:hypothetical protein [Armatimonadota bacterium]
GVELFLNKVVPNLAQLPCPAIVSIIGETVEQYRELTKALRGYEMLSAIEVNISSPNVERGGMEFGIDPDAAYEVVRAVRSVWDAEKDVWVKLSPHATNIATIAEQCINAGANVLSLINTVPAMALDVRSFPPRPLLGANMGGLSGPAIKPIAIRKVYEVARWMHTSNHRVPIVGIGGIWTANDIIEFFAVGANAVQIGTLLFHNPHAPRELCEGLKRYMRWVYSLTDDEKWLNIRHYTGCVALNA